MKRHSAGAYLKVVAALGVFVAAAGCVIFVKTEPPPVTPGTGVPSLTCTTPGQTAPTAHLIFATRIERTTANVAGTYAKIMEATAAGLGAVNIMTTHAVLLRLDERPVERGTVLAAWGCDLDDPNALRAEDVIRHYAQESLPASPIGCAIDPLLEMGEDMSRLTTSYPTELAGHSGRNIFTTAPSVVIVVHLDERARKTGYTDSACSRARELSVEDNDLASWLKYRGGAPEASRVVHWFIATEEAMDRDTFAARCASYDGFPTGILDTLEPSAKELYGPLSAQLENGGAGRVAVGAYCGMFVDSYFVPFMVDQIKAVAEIVGTEVNEEQLLSVLGGESGLELPDDIER